MAVVTGTGTGTVSFNEVISAGVTTPQTLPASITFSNVYKNGTAANQVDTIYAKQLTLAAAATTLDLTSLTDLSGAAINFARVREFAIQVVTGTAGFNVTLEGGAANPWAALFGTTSTMTLYAGATHYLLSDPTSTGAGVGAVVSGTSKTIKLDPGANTVTVNIVIVGGSAV